MGDLAFLIAVVAGLLSLVFHELSKRADAPTPLLRWTLENLPPGVRMVDGRHRTVFVRTGENEWSTSVRVIPNVIDSGIVSLLNARTVLPMTQEEVDAERASWGPRMPAPNPVPPIPANGPVSSAYSQEMLESFNRDVNAVFEDMNRVMREMADPQELRQAFRGMSQNIRDLARSIQDPETLRRLTEQQITQSGRSLPFNPTTVVKIKGKPKPKAAEPEPQPKSRLDHLLEDDDLV